MKFVFSTALLTASEVTANQIAQEVSAVAGLDSLSSSSIMHTVVEMELQAALVDSRIADHVTLNPAFTSSAAAISFSLIQSHFSAMSAIASGIST